MDQQITNAKRGMRKKATKKTIDDYLYHIVIGGFVLAVALTYLEYYYRDTRPLVDIPVIENEVITKHNNFHDSSYDINENDFFVDWSLQDAKNLFTTSLGHQGLPKCQPNKDELRENYDFRDEHSGCVAQALQVSQNCSSSFVLATLSAAADRHCKLNGQRIVLSPQQLFSCAGMTCEGGSSQSVIDYLAQNPSVSNDCMPYQPDQLGQCLSKDCQQLKVVKGSCVASKEDAIKREIQQNGPVVASVKIYRDFLLYQKGIYKPMDDMPRFKGRHQVKIVGWGKDQKKREFWILENSWGSTWGEEGYARVFIGFKDMLIDEHVLAPQVNIISE